MPAVLLLLLLALPLFAQTDIPQTYAQLCAGCHGADARGSQQGPGLSGNLRLRRRSAQSLRNVITRGIPAAGMPGFSLPEATLDGLVALVYSLNSVAADAKVPGDAAAGATYFFGAGRCSSCHMAAGRGAPIGPDLSGVARELTVEQLREALLTPSARLAPGYQVVTVARPGKAALRGFARHRSDYEIAVQDLQGGLHSIVLDEAARVTEQKTSAMPAAKVAGAELENLLAFLSTLAGVKPGGVGRGEGDGGGAGVDFVCADSESAAGGLADL